MFTTFSVRTRLGRLVVYLLEYYLISKTRARANFKRRYAADREMRARLGFRLSCLVVARLHMRRDLLSRLPRGRRLGLSYPGSNIDSRIFGTEIQMFCRVMKKINSLIWCSQFDLVSGNS